MYLNGAVIKVDRRVVIEVLNDVSFLLEPHILQAADATTPLRQLYFAVQSALMDPSNSSTINGMCQDMITRTIVSCENRDMQSSLCDVSELLTRGRYFEALKMIRLLYPLEAEIMDAAKEYGIESPRRIYAS